MRPTDPYFSSTKLLASAYEANGSTSSKDTSQSGRTLTATNSAVVSDAAPKFGNSLQVDRIGSKFWTVPHSTDFNLAGSSFTIDFWLYLYGLPFSVGDFFMLFSKTLDSGNDPRLFLYNNAGTQQLYFRSNGAELVTPVAHGLSATTWYHMEISSNGTTHRVRKNGTTLTTGSGTIVDGTHDLWIGAIDNAGSPTHVCNGRFCDFRWTAGVQRNSSDFTAPVYKAPNW
jgi:hypothetical protein